MHPKQIVTVFQQLGSVANLRPCFFAMDPPNGAAQGDVQLEWTQAAGILEPPQVKDDDHASQEQHDAQGQGLRRAWSNVFDV